MPDLNSSPVAGGNLGFLPTGGSGNNPSSSGGGDGNSFLANGGANLIGEGASLLTGLFGSNPAKGTATALTGDLSTLAKSLSASGDKSTNTGMDALAPVLKYLNGLMSGNPADTLSATAPERASVLSQYDTARQAITKSSPRGGGLALASTELNTKQAGDLAALPAKARTDAASAESQLGTTLTGQGIQAQSAAGSDLATAVQAANTQAAQQAQSNSAAGAGIGSLIADAIPFLFL